MKVRTRVRLISYTAAALLVILGAGITGYNLANTYETTIQYAYHRSLSQLSDYFSSIKNTLVKGEYANTLPQQYGLSSKLMVEAEGAKNALSQLPVPQEESEGIQKYLTQVSDFASFSIGVLSHNQTLSDDNKKALNRLAEYADEVAPQIEELSARFTDGTEHIGEISTLNGNLETHEEKEKTAFDNSFLTISESFADYPSLIYDGPFSDSVQQKTPKLTEDEQGYSVEQARQILADFLNKSKDDIRYKETRKGALPVYVFEGDSLYGTVTVKGGYVCEVYFTNNNDDNEKFVYEQLLIKAKDFLKQQKIDNMTDSYYITSNGVCTINFAYTENETICYGDLIKVGVSAANGRVVSYNAEGYIMNHHKRNLKSMSLSIRDAEKSVSDSLRIIGSKKALIPMSNGKEVQCYEYSCVGKNDENVLVYINGNTGLEEQIFILLESDNGTLVV